MTQAEFEAAVAEATGETRATIRQRGFSLVEPPVLRPLTVDWDELDAQRTAYLPDRQRSRRAA